MSPLITRKNCDFAFNLATLRETMNSKVKTPRPPDSFNHNSVIHSHSLGKFANNTNPNTEMRIVAISRLIILCTFLLALLQSCKKEPDYFRLTSDITDYFLFTPESYWIYENLSTGKTDSMYITLGPLRYDDDSQKETKGVIYDKVSMVMHGPFYSSCLLVPSSSHNECLIDAGYTIFCTNWDIGVPLKNGNRIYYTIANLDSLKQDGYLFKDVVVTSSIIPQYWGDTLTQIYTFARNVGLVKFQQQYQGTDTMWVIRRFQVFH